MQALLKITFLFILFQIKPFVKAQFTGNCGTNQYKIKINTKSTIDTCSKEISLSATYSGKPVYIQWNDGYVGANRTVKSSGDYQVFAFDSMWCADSSNIVNIALNDNYLFVSANTNTDEFKICKGQTVNLYCYASGAFKWNTNDTSLSISPTKSGKYFTTAISKNGCKDTSNVIKITFVDFNSLTIKANTDTIVCSNSPVELEFTSSTNSIYKYVWLPSGEYNTKKIKATVSGLYYVYAYDSISGCGGNSNKITVNIKTAPIQPLCMVSVDSITQKNKLIWKKINDSSIVSYNIYKESNFAGEFELIGYRKFSDPSEFIDSFSNPKQRPFTYYLAAVDSCGSEASESKYYAHTTLHLTANIGVSGENNLNWSDYLGIYPLNTYIIYRSNQNGSFKPIASVASSVHSYSDLEPPTGTNRYFIGIKGNYDCLDSNTNKIIYSNMVAFGLMKTQEFDNFISISPNPVMNQLNIHSLINHGIYQILNLQGQMVQTGKIDSTNSTIFVDQLCNGVYYLLYNNAKPVKFVKSF